MATSSPDSSRPVFRFAPSPNGRLHLGHALSALINQRMAARRGGRLLLRIEDIDLTRCRPEFEQAVHDDLAWLGLRFDGEVRRQSEHFADYAAALARLQARGLVYPCFCSRRQVKRAIAVPGPDWPADPDGTALYPGTCRGLEATDAARRVERGEAYVLRLAMDQAIARLPPPACGSEGRGGGPSPRQENAGQEDCESENRCSVLGRPLAKLSGPPIPNPSPPQAGGRGRALSSTYRLFDAEGREGDIAIEPARWGDVVLARRETPTSYHLSVVVDDALQGVTHVVRGRDLEAATDIHVVLQRLLDLPTPLYHFHDLLFDETGQKLAKSRMSESLADLRARGVTASQVRAQLGFG